MTADLVTPEMLRAAQQRSELGAYACANLSGAYGLLRELFNVMAAAQPQPKGTAPENLPTKEHIRELAQEALDQIMEQAQVFASAWSLVGGKFDFGNAMSDAEDAKTELRTMVRSLADLAAETVRPVQAPAPAPGEVVGKMTAQRAKFFLQRFKREEKLLGPNEQAGLDYAIAALEREQYAPAAQAPAVKDDLPPGVVVSAYRIGDALNAVRIERSGQIDGPDLWAVRGFGGVLNKDGAWEWEPMPSNRDDAFLARCRFATHSEAISAAMRESQPPVQGSGQ